MNKNDKDINQLDLLEDKKAILVKIGDFVAHNVIWKDKNKKILHSINHLNQLDRYELANELYNSFDKRWHFRGDYNLGYLLRDLAKKIDYTIPRAFVKYKYLPTKSVASIPKKEIPKSFKYFYKENRLKNGIIEDENNKYIPTKNPLIGAYKKRLELENYKEAR